MSVILTILTVVNLTIFPFFTVQEGSSMYQAQTVIKASVEDIRGEIFKSKKGIDPIMSNVIDVIENEE